LRAAMRRAAPRSRAGVSRVGADAEAPWVAPYSLALRLPLRRLGQEAKLGHQPRLVEVNVDLRKLAALELRNHRDRQPNGLVRGWNGLAPRHLQGPRVGCSHVAQLCHPISGAELRFRHQPDVGECLEKRLETRSDGLRPLNPLGILWVPLKYRIQMGALELCQASGIQAR